MHDAALQKKFISYKEYEEIDIKQKSLEKKSLALLSNLTSAFEGVKKDLDNRIDGNCEKVLKRKFEAYDKVKVDF